MKKNIAVSLLVSLLAGCGSSSDDGASDTTPVVTPTNNAPTIVITTSNDFTQADGAEAGAVVSTFTTADADGDTVTVSLSGDTSNYEILNNTVVLTSAGAALVNSGTDLPEYTLTPNDGTENGASASDDPTVTAENGTTPVNSAPTIAITTSNDFTQADGAEAGAVVSTFTTADADSDTVTVTVSDTGNYLVEGNNVVLTEDGASLVNAGADLPAYDLTPNDGTIDGESVSHDPSVTPTGGFTGVPYDYDRYKNALDNANLQQNDLTDCTGDDINDYCSKSDVVDAGEYAGYESEYFYINEATGNLTFEMEGDSNRTELRFEENFLTDLTDTQYALSAEVMPINPVDSVSASTDGQEMTLLQVHNKGTSGDTDDSVLSHPLMRIVWDGESRKDDFTGESATGAYWAIIKTNAYECSNTDGTNYLEDCPDSYDNHYLGEFTEGEFTKFEIIVRNSELIVEVNDIETVNENIDYWSELYSYFKAGVYNQYESGNSVVEFKTVTYSETAYSEEDEVTPGEGELDPYAAPAENFDLSYWNLSVPIDNGEGDGYEKATTVTVEELNDDYQLTDYFWTDELDGGMVFKDYIAGARTSEGTSYTRTELREMLRGTNDDIDTQGINGNNWVFSSVPEELQKRAGGVDGKMTATVAVNYVTTTGYASNVGRVIIGQIHAASDEPIRLYYRKLPDNTKGSIYFAHEPSNGNDEQWYEMIGEKSSSADDPEDGIELGEQFSYEIIVEGDLMTVNILRDGKDTVTQEVDMSESGYNDGYYDKDGDGADETEDYMYFKAGVYNQNKMIDEDEDGVDDYDTDPDDYVQATFYSLTHSHDDAPE